MTGDLRRDSLLRAKASDGDNGGQNSTNLAERCCGRRVGEERTVMRAEDVDRKIGVRFGQFGEKFGRVGLVDVVPQGKSLSLRHVLNIARGQLPVA